MKNFKINSFCIEQFKILNNFSIDFNDSLTVLIGENGSGKSSIIEALSFIYGHLYKYYILKDEKANFIGSPYTINFNSVLENGEIANIIIKNKDYDTFDHDVIIDNEIYSKSDAKKYFSTNDNVLPKIVLYYSGITNHLKILSEHFEEKYRKEISNTKNDYIYTLFPLVLPKYRPFFYIKNKHLEIILLSLLLSNNEYVSCFLSDTIKIDFLSVDVNITIKEPLWSKKIKDAKTSSTYILERWGITNRLAFHFLEGLISYRENTRDEINEKDSKIVLNYSVINLKAILSDIIENDLDKNIFEILDFLLFDDLLDKIEITWQNKNGDKISIDDISEGEKQLTLIKGLSHLNIGRNLLFLLDEPDTFLHPRWQAEFVENLNSGLQGRQAIVTTHSPNLISDITDSQLYIIEKGIIKTSSFNTYGKSIEKIIANTFYSPIRNIKTENLIKLISEKIENNEYDNDEFKRYFSELENTIDNNDTIFLSFLFDINRKKTKDAQNK